MATEENLESLTLQQLKELAATEGIAGTETFTTKGQVITIITAIRGARQSVNPAPSANVPTPPNIRPTNIQPEQAAAPKEPVAPVEASQPSAPESGTTSLEAPEDKPAADEPELIQAKSDEQLAAEQAAANPAPQAPAAPTPPVTAHEEVTDEQEWKKGTDTMKAILDAQPKIRILIPLEIGEKRGAYETVIINGYRIDILKNVYADVPESVANVIQESYNQTAQVGKDLELGRVDPETGRPVANSMGLRG